MNDFFCIAQIGNDFTFVVNVVVLVKKNLIEIPQKRWMLNRSDCFHSRITVSLLLFTSQEPAPGSNDIEFPSRFSRFSSPDRAEALCAW